MEKKIIQNKKIEVKQPETKKEADLLSNWNYDEFESNVLALSDELKSELQDLGLEWRFINKTSFANKGNIHGRQWKPYHVTNKNVVNNFKGVDPEGILTRGDLILAVRPKKLGNQYRKRKLEKNARYAAFNKAQAEELRTMAKRAGLDEEQLQVHEGYEDN